MPNIWDASKLSALIGVIGRQKVRIDGMIQTAAVQCIAQSIVHRNSTPAAQLYEAVGDGTRRDALLKYFELHGNLCWSKAEKRVTFYDVEKIENKPKLDWTDEYAAKVTAYLWTKAKPEPKTVSMYDVEEKVSALIDSLRKAAKKGVALKHVDLLNRIESLYVSYVSEEFVKSAKPDEKVQEKGELAEKVADAKKTAMADAYMEAEQKALAEQNQPELPAPALVVNG